MVFAIVKYMVFNDVYMVFVMIKYVLMVDPGVLNVFMVTVMIK